MAFFRALESVRPPGTRLFHDPLAVHFLRPALRGAVELSRAAPLGRLVNWYADRRLPGGRTSGIARTRCIDDAVRGALAAGIDQVVILGAGFDCRAYRLPDLARTAVFEIDHAATQARKIDLLRRALPNLPDHVHFVAIDFNRQRLADVLQQAGYTAARRAVFVWEGVSNYLSAEAVAAVLRTVAGGAAGTRLIFTYVHRRALDGSGMFADAAKLLHQVAKLGEPWTFGLDPDELLGYLRQHGLRLDRDLGARDYRALYFGAASASMRGYDFYRVAEAQVADE